MGKKILVIDDERMILDAIELILGDLGHEVSTFSDPVLGQNSAIENDYDLILTDLRMPGRNGAQLSEAVLGAKPNAKILVITAYPTDHLAAQAMQAGAVGLIKKPFEITKILDYLKD
ncbi:MAG TPA: response regulator [Spirochaetia bacterium]|nr:response regulator [Spirochaetia bacterium]